MELKQRQWHYEPEEPLRQWNQLLDLYYSEFSPEGDPTEEWMFRGDHPNPRQCLRIPGDVFESHLDRAFKSFGVKDPTDRRKIERRLIRTFRRKALLHTSWPLESWLDTLALMQHYGAPTRLLDWTYSFFAAVFFAINRAEAELEDQDTGCGSCVVWGLNAGSLARINGEYERQYTDNVVNEQSEQEKKDRVREKIERQRREGRRVFESALIHDLIMAEEQPSLVYAVNPYSLHERLSTQKGVLLCQGSIDKSWGANLKSVLERDDATDCPIRLCRIPIVWDDHNARNQILRRLYEMNIDQGSLFPGLDGFAGSLRTGIASRVRTLSEDDLRSGPKPVDTTNRVKAITGAVGYHGRRQ